CAIKLDPSNSADLASLRVDSITNNERILSF
ncbi:MAG: hypothetical protein ACI9T7_002070, partial [Oleiphilaceae bacterium]